MKPISSRKPLLFDAVIVIILLYLAFTGLHHRSYGEPNLYLPGAHSGRNLMRLGDEGEFNETKRRTEMESNTLGTKKSEVKQEAAVASKRKEDALPSVEMFGGAALLDLEQYSPEDLSVLKGRIGVMTERASAISRVCSAAPLLSDASPTKSFIWDTKHTPNIVWCPIYKVASTTWMSNFYSFVKHNNTGRTRNKGNEKKLLFSQKLVHALYRRPTSPEEREKVLKNSIRLIIVRHPFTRILSAYRDKMLNKNPGPEKFKFKELQADIVRKYRSPDSADNSRFPSFPEFVQFVIDSTRNLKSSNGWKKNVKCWLPYWVHCSVCSLDYNVIMKLETMDEDKRFLTTLSRLDEIKGDGEWIHLNNVSSSVLSAEYYKALTRHQILQLYKRYEPDFKLFQYDIKDYLDNAKDSEDGTVNNKNMKQHMD